MPRQSDRFSRTPVGSWRSQAPCYPGTAERPRARATRNPSHERLPVDFSPVQIIIVLAIILLVFGAKRLPEIGRSLGSSAREFKQGITGADDDAVPPSTPSSTPSRHDETT